MQRLAYLLVAVLLCWTRVAFRGMRFDVPAEPFVKLFCLVETSIRSE